MIVLLLWLRLQTLPAAVAFAEHTGLEVAAASDLATAAALVADEHLTVAVLLGVAYVESRGDGTSVSRVVAGRRVTGRWPSSRQVGQGPWFCGTLQARATTWKACLDLRPVFAGVAAGAAELRYWLRRTRGDLTLALRAHGCGHAGLAPQHRCRGYAERVLRRAERYRPYLRS